MGSPEEQSKWHSLASHQHGASAVRRDSGADHGCASFPQRFTISTLPTISATRSRALLRLQPDGIRDQRAQSGARNGEERRDLAAQDSHMISVLEFGRAWPLPAPKIRDDPTTGSFPLETCQPDQRARSR